MTLSDTAPAPARNRRAFATGAAGAATVLPILAAAFVLIAPIVLWVVFGTGDPQHTIGVAAGSAILAWAVARRAGERDVVAAPAVAEVRRAAPPRACRSQQCRPAGAGRLNRNVRCSVAVDAPAGRPARRRARP